MRRSMRSELLTELTFHLQALSFARRGKAGSVLAGDLVQFQGCEWFMRKNRSHSHAVEITPRPWKNNDQRWLSPTVQSVFR